MIKTNAEVLNDFLLYAKEAEVKSEKKQIFLMKIKRFIFKKKCKELGHVFISGISKVSKKMPGTETEMKCYFCKIKKILFTEW